MRCIGMDYISLIVGHGAAAGCWRPMSGFVQMVAWSAHPTQGTQGGFEEERQGVWACGMGCRPGPGAAVDFLFSHATDSRFS